MAIKDKQKRKAYHKEYHEKNKDKIKDYLKKYRDNNKDKAKEYLKTHPWLSIYSSAKQRCNNKNNKKYKYYGGKGIKCLITSEEIKKLWFRDKAYLMKKPSIDRENSNGNYEYDNCRFIELLVNMKRVVRKTKPILQYDLEGNFIKEWVSQEETGRELKIERANIVACCNNRRKSAGGFIWKYKFL